MSFSNLEKAFSTAKLASKDWFSQVSAASFEGEVDDLLQNYAWPTPKIENWKYTNLLKLAKLEFWPSEQEIPASLPPVWKEFLTRGFESSFVFWNGRYAPSLSKVSKSNQFQFSQIQKVSTFSKLESESELEKVNQLLLNDLYSFEVKTQEKIERVRASNVQRLLKIHCRLYNLLVNTVALIVQLFFQFPCAKYIAD